MKKGIGYYRISTIKQEENTSLDEQREKVRGFCKSQDIKSVAEFEDTASGGNCDRSGYQAALDYIEEHPGEIACFVVYKLDRVHRHQQNLLVFESNLRDRKISFVSVCELIDTNTPQGKLMFQILGSFAEFEKNTIVERTRNGRKAKLSRKETAGGKIPYGYDLSWNIVPEEAENIRLLFREYLKLKSLRKVVEFANEQGIKSKAGRDFSAATLRKVLINRVYLGEYSYDGKQEKHGVVIKQHHERIIADSTFGKVQKALRRCDG